MNLRFLCIGLLALPVSTISKTPDFAVFKADVALMERLPLKASQVVGNVKIKIGRTLRTLRRGDRIDNISQLRFARRENKVLVQDVNKDCFWILSTAGGTGSCGQGCALKLEQYKGNCSLN